MSTYTFTLIVDIDADNLDDAWDEFTAWLTSPSNVENGTIITLPENQDI